MKRSLRKTARATVRATRAVAQTTLSFSAHKVRLWRTQPVEHPAQLEKDLQRWAQAIVRALNVRLQVDGDLTTEEGLLVVANHRSLLDIPVLMSLRGGRMVSRADVARWPVFGAISRHTGHVFVDRGSRSSRAAAVRAIHKELAAGNTVFLFPEGTTHRGDAVRPFQSGAFRAAARLGVGVAPVGLAYPPGAEWGEQGSFGAHLAALASEKRLEVAACVGRPMKCEASQEEFAQTARNHVQTLVDRARSLLDEAE